MSAIATASQQQLFLDHYYPEIVERSARHFSYLDADARGEMVQESVAQSWASFVSADRQGKTSAEGKNHASAGTLAWYANRSVTAGRRFAGSSTTDTLADGTRAAEKVTLVSLDADSDNGHFLRESVSDTRSWANPLDATRRRLDWRLIAKRCNRRQRRVLSLLVRGYGTGEIAERVRVTPGRVCQIRTELQGVIRSVGYGP